MHHALASWQVEARAEGSVDKNVYWQYLSAWSPFFIIPVGMLAAGVIERSLQVRKPPPANHTRLFRTLARLLCVGWC